MALFSKDYHPLDKRHPRNRVQTARTPRVKTCAASSTCDATAPKSAHETDKIKKISDSARMATLAAQTQERRLAAAKQHAVTSPFVAPNAPQKAALKPATTARHTSRSGLSKAFQIIANFDRNLRIGMLIAAVIFILTQPGMLTDMLGTLTTSTSVDLMQSTSKYSSNF
ncbi:MAG: hypothetical protein ACJAR9_001465 [Celeribacter sp.]